MKVHRRATFLVGCSLALAIPLLSQLGCEDDQAANQAPAPSGTLPGLDAAPTSTTPPVPPQQDAGGNADAGHCSIGADDTISATLKITADDYLTLWVNGVLIDDKTSTWGTVDTKTVTLFRNPSKKNVIAVDALNAANQGGLDRGLLAELSLGADAGTTADGGVVALVTDTSWRIAPSAPDGGVLDGGLPDGGVPGVTPWFATAFDDASWVASTDEGAQGVAPWGNVFGTSTAHWLWSYDSSTAVSKPETEHVYFRRSFYLSVAGTPQDTASSCP
jgi:hypothetical protein